jgi:GNAT superfamily N-acetyltransferase
MARHAIRPATLGDLAAVERVVQDAYHPWALRIGRKPGPMLDDYAALIAAGRVEVVERPSDGVCAVLVLIPQADAMLLDNVAVAPRTQGLGIGGALIAHAQAAARAAGHARLRLYTHQAMTTNIALYARLGFHETHRATEAGLHRVYMELPLG